MKHNQYTILVVAAHIASRDEDKIPNLGEGGKDSKDRKMAKVAPLFASDFGAGDMLTWYLWHFAKYSMSLTL